MARPITSLHRLSQALVARTGTRVRTTDWWAVVVEIAVVVLGIIIAFQLNEWDQRRQARQEARQVLNHLGEETAADIAAISKILEEHKQSADNYRLLITAVGDPVAAEAYRRRGDTGCNLLRMPAIRYHSPRGLEAGERADLIDDATLRHLIRRADAERAFNDRQLDFFRASFHRYGDVLEKHMLWRPTDAGEFDCRVDIAALAADGAAVALLPKAGRDQLKLAEYRERELDSTRDVARRARCLRQGKCSRV